MAMKTSHALEDQIDRRQIGDEQVEVDVERLLDDLRCYDDGAMGTVRAAAGRAELLQQLVVLGEPVTDREPCVVDAHLLSEL
ncbi:MAG: hypothetical protein Q605_AUC00999G0002 [Actinomyces urogenitalis DORA_12]|uniref:Uncharacterized protein n=1 Tax=Actinomyces urogenitalis DORA_12 TaxID=1403939 RepID=W1V9A8_9ACTO|nr:MAG: hypothetical protein Q605_AUC00999G0002 [Actinomyces urogenitalis DORA_12]